MSEAPVTDINAWSRRREALSRMTITAQRAYATGIMHAYGVMFDVFTESFIQGRSQRDTLEVLARESEALMAEFTCKGLL